MDALARGLLVATNDRYRGLIDESERVGTKSWKTT
jgi:hypothetical protein